MKKNNKSNVNKIYAYLVFSVVFLVILVGYGIYQLTNRNDTKSLLINKSYGVVYTIYEDEENEKQVPVLNIKGISDDINKEISNFVEPYLDESTNKISYEYQINGNILSLIITIENYEIEGPADYKYLSYNINLKNKEVLSNDDVYKLFGLNEEYLLRVLDDKFRSYYEDMKNKKIIVSNESYEEYLKLHEIYSFSDQFYCYIQDGKLNVYLDYNEWASNETENYFVLIGHIFTIE